jgi:thiol:disulfide interchange protein
MPERMVLVLALAAVIAAAVFAARSWNRSRLQALQAGGPNWQALGVEPDGRRTVIAFSTRRCAACHEAQAPAIDLAREQLGADAVRVIKIDAARQPAAARAFGILTVPSTVVVTSRGDQIVAVNQGFAPSARLVQQLRQAEKVGRHAGVRPPPEAATPARQRPGVDRSRVSNCNDH